MGKPALDISTLTPDEKCDLIDDLWRSLSPGDLPLQHADRDELDRRLDRLDREGAGDLTWAEVYAEMGGDEP
jgi:putative addiction module component (TIGR02574 family)